MTRTAMVLVTVALFRLSASAQYFYKDIHVLQQTQQQYKLQKANKVKIIRLQSFEGNGMPSENFFCEQSLSNRYMDVTTVSKTPFTGESVLTARYNVQEQLYKITDSSAESVSTTSYSYNAAGQVVSILNQSRAAVDNYTVTEEHLWQYNGAGKPTGMISIRNGKDSSFVTFTLDEKGNVTEETAGRRGGQAVQYYYYYDAANRLTDVVRFNERSRRLLPDFTFQYNPQGQLYEMTTTNQGNQGYYTWRYIYDERGLKIKELAYIKRQSLAGKIEYSYEFGR
jgi:YD repeat-containing protein